MEMKLHFTFFALNYLFALRIPLFCGMLSLNSLSPKESLCQFPTQTTHPFFPYSLAFLAYESRSQLSSAFIIELGICYRFFLFVKVLVFIAQRRRDLSASAFAQIRMARKVSWQIMFNYCPTFRPIFSSILINQNDPSLKFSKVLPRFIDSHMVCSISMSQSASHAIRINWVKIQYV
jgi:hypothetical protein